MPQDSQGQGSSLQVREGGEVHPSRGRNWDSAVRSCRNVKYGACERLSAGPGVEAAAPTATEAAADVGPPGRSRDRVRKWRRVADRMVARREGHGWVPAAGAQLNHTVLTEMGSHGPGDSGRPANGVASALCGQRE